MPSPSFSVDGGSSNTKAETTAGASVVALLDDVSGVHQVDWTISRADDATSVGTVEATKVLAGSIGQQATYTAQGTGTAFVIKCTVNGGLDQYGSVDTTLSQEVKVWVPTAGGMEVLVAGEQGDDDDLSSSTHGVVKPLNDAIRQWNSFTGGATGPDGDFETFAETVTANTTETVYTYTPTITDGLVRVAVFAGASDVGDTGSGRMGFHRAAWYTITGGTMAEVYNSLTESPDPNAEAWSLTFDIDTGGANDVIDVNADLDASNDTFISGLVMFQEFQD